MQLQLQTGDVVHLAYTTAAPVKMCTRGSANIPGPQMTMAMFAHLVGPFDQPPHDRTAAKSGRNFLSQPGHAFS